MSIILFELKEDHLKLLKHLKWSLKGHRVIDHTATEVEVPLMVNIGGEDEEDQVPFGLNTLYEGMDLILNGKGEDVDLLNKDEFAVYSDEQQRKWLDLYNELPMALEVILNAKTFNPGTYKTKHHYRDWKEIKNK